MKYMIGVDIGTTSTKSVLYDENGQFIMKHNIGSLTYSQCRRF